MQHTIEKKRIMNDINMTFHSGISPLLLLVAMVVIAVMDTDQCGILARSSSFYKVAFIWAVVKGYFIINITNN